VYCSLDKVDFGSDRDGRRSYVQTDHRDRDEIESTPEVSVLFAMTRVINARRIGRATGEPFDVVYATRDVDVPPMLVEAVAATGALLQRGLDGAIGAPEPTTTTAAEIADRAFTALALRAQRRLGLAGPSLALRALEAEVAASPPDRDGDEHGYWTRVLELSAVAIAAIRLRHRGEWVESEHADIPFGYQYGSGVTLPTNRAQRFLAHGSTESMFLLLASADEMAAHADDASRPVLPSLRARHEAGDNMLWRPLLPGIERDDLPVILYGHDGERTFGLLTLPRDDDPDTIHAEALANLSSVEVEVESIDVHGHKVAVVSGSFFATEKILDPEFMHELHGDLGDLLAVAVPRRGLMFVTGAIESQAVSAIAALADHEHAEASRPITPTVLLVQDGAVVGFADTDDDDDGGGDPDDDPDDRDGKPGLLRRLFGRD
jgi:hypothetical protein